MLETNPQEPDVIPTHDLVDYRELSAKSQDLPPQYRPVDLESGRQTLAEARAGLEAFRRQILPEVGLGDRTRNILDRKIRDGLLGTDGIFITGQAYAQYAWEELPDQRDNLAIGQPVVEAHQLWVDLAAQDAHAELSPEQVNDLGVKWVIWHELGHGIQICYSEAAAHGDKPASLSADALRAGIAPVIIEHPTSEPQRLGNFRRIVEGFAEGFAQMLIEQYAVDELGLDPERADALRRSLTPQHRIESADKSVRFLMSEGISIAPASKVFMEGAFEAGGEVGYGNPLTPDQVRAVLASTP